ncbi:transketolase [Dickeya oryzae]|uniref:transketolase n=1 Tax=Dickeya oryzae TaxID=1240404 RepID=UPI001AED06A1|nr:transketolase [Dickeya oryzae]
MIKLLHNAYNIRKKILDVAYAAPVDGVHIGSSLSLVEILVALYGYKMRYDAANINTVERDSLLLSKGHAALALYSTLHEFNIITSEQLNSFDINGSIFQALAPKYRDVGSDFAGGSLGHGVSYGIGLALSHRLRMQPWHTYVLVGDGECNEGSIWEAAFLANQLKLDSLTVIVDNNKLQSDGLSENIINMNFKALWLASGWQVIECDGNDLNDIIIALNTPHSNKPKAIIANTIKGRGVAFMEGDNNFHRAHLSEKQYIQAIEDLNKGN